MSAMGLTVIVVVIPAFSGSLLVLALDSRGQRRRRPPAGAPRLSRLTAVLGAALGVAGFGLASVAGIGGIGHAAGAAETPEGRLWITSAAAGASAETPAPPDRTGEAPVLLPYAPLGLWGAGLDEASGSYRVLAEVADGNDIALLASAWQVTAGDGRQPLAVLDPAAVVAAARAHGVVPENGVYALELRSSDPETTLHLALAAPPQASAPAPITAPVAAAAAARPPATGAPAPAPSRVSVPATGGGARLLGGLAMLLAGGACAGLSLRLRRAAAA
ncbi:MAG TPA: hypothetical protein VGL20_02060 [Candidatus Dormibacteraeota bacterium]|jgi:hypothetical protein